MAITAFPFDNQDTDETQFTTWAKELQDSGVVDTAGGTGFAVAAGTGMNVTVQPGTAIVRGHMVTSNAIETLSIPAAGAATMQHRVILRLDPTANSITLLVLAGTSGGGLPALNQTASGIFELVIAHVTINSGTVNVTAGMISDQRSYVGHRLRVWDTGTRPSGARMGATGYNRTTGKWEFWTGSAWTDLVPDIEPGRVEMTMNTTAPAGWHLIAGQSISKTTNPVLFSLFGYTYGGSGDNFNLPNMADRAPVGVSGSKALRAMGGSDTATLQSANLPPHAHGMDHNHPSSTTGAQNANHNHGYDWITTGTVSVAGGGANPVYRADRSHTASSVEGQVHGHAFDIPWHYGSTGNGPGTSQAFSIQNYFFAINFIIKAG